MTGEILECNETLLQKTGFNRSEVIGKHFFSLFHPDSLETAKRNFEIFNETGKIENAELDLITNTGEKLPVLKNSTAVRDKNGNILHSRTVLQDITERKLIEQELVATKEKAVESDNLKSAFLANMSHEIRTPMNGILGFSHLLIDSQPDIQEKEKYIEAIENSTQQLLHIITDIMDISKIESGQEKTCNRAFNLNKLLGEIFRFYQPKAIQKKLILSLITEPTFDKKNIFCDPIKLRQILGNVIENAIKFTDEGHVEIEVTSDNQRISFEVRDTGIGIDLSMQDIIFDRFRQVESSYSRKYGGTGLGLSLAKSYVEMMDGSIKVESTQGIGSEFCFDLPFVPDRAFLRDEFNNDEVSFENKWCDKTILVAEDEEFNMFYLQTALKPTGVKIITAFNGLEAVELCEKNMDISLVLMDIKMPVMDGYTATKIIKLNRKRLPVIAVTAHAFASDEEKCFEAGCDGYISKPIKKEKMLQMMSEFI